MKIVVASDSFKGSCTTVEVAEAVERGIKRVHPDAEVVKIPVADGGEGSVDALVLGTGGSFRELEVIGPLGNKVKAKYGLLGDRTAVIEMAAASGLPLVPADKRNPMLTTTFGTGQLVKAALDEGCRKIFIGIGGSATNDAGMGMAQALGVSFKDADGRELGYGGGALGRLARIDCAGLDPRIKAAEIIAACDVSNPLYGEKGASAVYGPQKGATAEMVRTLDSNLRHLAAVVSAQLQQDIVDVPGAGAAGGMGAGLMVFCKAVLRPGIETVLDMVGMERHLHGTDLVITGEGRIDGQSIYGKVPVGVAKRAKKYGIPVLAIVGGIGDGASAVYNCGIDGITSIVSGPMCLEQAMENSVKLIEDTAERVLRLIAIGKKIQMEG